MIRAPAFMAAVLLVLGLLGCQPQGAERIGDRFVDLYFVEIDQRRALTLSSGLARNKLEEELGLVAEVRKQLDPEQAKPSIFYVRRDSRIEGDHARLSYDLTIRQDRDETKRNALLSMERKQGRWTVANFMVREGHLTARPAAP